MLRAGCRPEQVFGEGRTTREVLVPVLLAGLGLLLALQRGEGDDRDDRGRRGSDRGADR